MRLLPFLFFRKHEHRLKSKETNKKNKACLKNEYMAPNDLNKIAGPVYVFLFNL